MKNAWIQVRIHPDFRRRFKAVCKAEGETMSDKIRQLLILYTNEHEAGNPQTLLMPREEKSMLQQVLEDTPVDDFPLTRVRRERTLLLIKFLNDHSEMSRSAAISQFALRYGHRVRTVRRYVRLIDRVRRGQ